MSLTLSDTTDVAQWAACSCFGQRQSSDVGQPKPFGIMDTGADGTKRGSEQFCFLKSVAQSVLLWRGQVSSAPKLNPDHPLMGPHPTD